MNPLTAIRPWMPPELTPGMSLNSAAPGMPASIPPQELQGLTPSPFIQPSTSVNPAGGTFDNMVGQLLTDVVAKQSEAGRMVNGVLSSQGVPLHQAMIAMQEANVSFQLMIEVRNKLLESYQELMRMQV